ncbi:hypothetical protein BDF20DRAFT_823081 [Mycotypha africana]|uniref:uncharacterized protein n=1 Tax=Mycotypha africana TaxID=64632 RepID=UPI002300842F|nr:uncharacterized protein BDF20DRAFT_823081 [Mycotypha africana]KAI8975470.1 hypothetical protein BDF20DRAFT_823081 [Mycotypha africana]
MRCRKQLTVAEKRNQEHISFVQGCKGAAYGVGIGLLASVVSFRFSPAFRALSRPYQYSMLATGGFTGYMFGSERGAYNYGNEVLGYVDHKTMDKRVYQNYKSLIMSSGEVRSKKEKLIYFINEHRWAILGTTWASSMISACAYSFCGKKHLTAKQKFYHARIYAQALTLTALIVTAGISFYGEEKEKELIQQYVPDERKLRAVLELPKGDQHKKLMIQ